MSVAMKQPREVVRLWEMVAAGEEESLKTIFQGYRSTLDYPGCMHFATFLRWNEGAKVILTVRDSPEQWAQSARSTIYSSSWQKTLLTKLLFSLPLTNFYYLQYIQKIAFSAHKTNPTKRNSDLETLYIEWNNHVIETVPDQRLLVYNVKEGWEPLCRFLEVPIPDDEFPFLNDSREFKKVSLFENTSRLICIAAIVTVLVVIALGLTFGLHQI
jgi:hypothetical protein